MKVKPLKTSMAEPRTFKKEGIYDGADLKPTVQRAGAYDGLKHPSRIGDKLHYRDGRVEHVS